MSDKGLFGGLFDFNGDGKLDSFERAAEFGMFMQMIDSEKNDALTSAGLNPDDLEDMGYFERREALEDAALTPMILNKKQKCTAPNCTDSTKKPLMV